MSVPISNSMSRRQITHSTITGRHQVFAGNTRSNSKNRRGLGSQSSCQECADYLNSGLIAKFPLGGISSTPTFLSFWALLIQPQVFRQDWYRDMFYVTISWHTSEIIRTWNVKRYRSLFVSWNLLIVKCSTYLDSRNCSGAGILA